MANPLKQLAGETAIYGLSTILARIVNFLLVPLYTRILTESDYGVITEFMAIIAILQVVLVMGLETGCFKFASREDVDRNAVFSNAFLGVGALSLLFFVAVTIFSPQISCAMGYEGFSNIIIYVGAILLIDCTTSILFVRQRYEHKAVRFATIKTLKIFTEVGVNLVLYLVMPKVFAANPDHFLLNFVSAKPDFTYAIFAIFVSCIVALVMLIPDICHLKLKIDRKLWKPLLLYSIPIMIAGLPGIMNDMLDRILMRFLNADPVMWRADLGVYQAGVKIAVIMSLFIQMFRYASEPFFFQRQKDKKRDELYITVMNYFVAFCMFGFLAIMLYIDVIGLIIGRDFRAGLSIAPIMLMAYAFLGILTNVNMWYKLSGKTKYAIYVTLAGLIVSVVLNVLFMPIYSYHAAAWAHLASYVVMLIVSVMMGRKHYHIPYNWGLITVLIAAALGLYGISFILPEMGFLLKMIVHTLLIFVYIAISFVALKYGKKLVKPDMKVKIVNKSAYPSPRYATPYSAGLDLKANIAESVVLKPLERTMVPTGLYIELPAGYEAQVRPRSGLAAKHGITVINSPGTIDADYRGEVCVLLVNLSNEEFAINPGERIAQMVVAKHEVVEWEEVEVLEESERGIGGFGSTGTK